jgi:hypothetical protein
MRAFFAASTGQTSSLVKTPPKRFPAGDGLSVHANLQKSHRWDSHLTLYLYCRLRLENSAWSDFDSHKRLLRECFLSHSPSGLIPATNGVSCQAQRRFLMKSVRLGVSSVWCDAGVVGGMAMRARVGRDGFLTYKTPRKASR